MVLKASIEPPEKDRKKGVKSPENRPKNRHFFLSELPLFFRKKIQLLWVTSCYEEFPAVTCQFPTVTEGSGINYTM
jgi:hypothetical protein